MKDVNTSSWNCESLINEINLPHPNVRSQNISKIPPEFLLLFQVACVLTWEFFFCNLLFVFTELHVSLIDNLDCIMSGCHKCIIVR